VASVNGHRLDYAANHSRLGPNVAIRRVEAYIRPNALEAVKTALEEVGVRGLSCEQVRGFGRQQGQTESFRGSTYALNLVPKMRVDVIVEEDMVEDVVQALVEATRTGEVGDGKVFVSEVLEAVRVRTGERGVRAIT